MDPVLFASLAANALAVLACLYLAGKAGASRMDRLALEEANKGLRKAVAEMKPDAERGKRSRLQAAAALVKANRVNRERNAAKVAGK